MSMYVYVVWYLHNYTSSVCSLFYWMCNFAMVKGRSVGLNRFPKMGWSYTSMLLSKHLLPLLSYNQHYNVSKRPISAVHTIDVTDLQKYAPAKERT